MRELLQALVPKDTPGRPKEKNYTGTDINTTRTQAAKDAGLSKWQKDTVLRVAKIPKEEFEEAE